MPEIKIYNPGLLTTVQDLGRFGYQQYGMPVSGAMDTYSLKFANFLVGNNSNEACLEATVTGPEIEFESETFIAVCGADMQAKLNGKDAGMYVTIPVKQGDKLTFQSLKNGIRTYVAFAGGIDVPVVMGSKSTYLRGKMGGFNGRQLLAGDKLKIGIPAKKIKIKEANKKQIPIWNDYFIARIIAGPEANYFTMNGLANFLNSEYKLSVQSDRMGYRLSGEKIEHQLPPDIISSGIAFGTIQVPSHGEPIVMMADRQSTGGYPRIANVISADLPYLAQLQPGNTLRFLEINLKQAHELFRKLNNINTVGLLYGLYNSLQSIDQ
jgi:biotin-dependent carboxylase-like uncharacterized protein